MILCINHVHQIKPGFKIICVKVEQVRRTTRTVICTINKQKGCHVKNLEIYKVINVYFIICFCSKKTIKTYFKLEIRVVCGEFIRFKEGLGIVPGTHKMLF